MAGEVSFFELGVADVELARSFYGRLLGWRFEPGPSGQGLQIGTPNVPGGVHGGDPAAGPYLFFRVDDLDAAVAHVRELGGEVDDDDIGGDEGDGESDAQFGRFRLCRDDQGSPFGLHQPPPGG